MKVSDLFEAKMTADRWYPRIGTDLIGKIDTLLARNPDKEVQKELESLRKKFATAADKKDVAEVAKLNARLEILFKHFAAGLKESLNEGFAIKLKTGKWYSEERPSLGPLKGGNSQVRVFKSMNAADDFLIFQSNQSGYTGKKFEDAEIKRYNPKKLKEDTNSKLADAIAMNWLSWSNSKIVAELQKLVKLGKWPELKGMSGDQLEDLVDDAKYDAKNKVDESLNEDWGSSDWYPVMQAMKRYIESGHSMKDAASLCADTWYQDMGWEEAAQAETQILAKYKRSVGHDAHKYESKVVEGITYQLDKAGVKHKLKGPNDIEGIEKWKNYTPPKKVSTPKVRPEKYTQEWWEAKEERADYGSVLTPWTRIELGMGNGELSTDELEAVGKDQGFGNVDDFHKIGTGETRVDGVDCATIRVRVVAVYTKEDDLGIEGDDPVSDSYNVMLRRDTKNPAKFVFMRYL